MAIIKNLAKQRLNEGKLSIGMGVHHLRGSAVGALGAAAGFDWLFIDLEHNAMSVEGAAQISMAALNQGCTPIVRCCKDALFEGGRCLDNGAMGVVVPHVDTADEARAIVQAYRFPPLGQRSWGGPPILYGFAAPEMTTAQREINEEILVVCMLESEQSIDNCEAMAAVEGVDVLLFGTGDLSADMGIFGQVGHPRIRAAYEKVAAACKKHGKVMGMGGVYDEVVARDYIAMGARFVLGGSDHSFLMSGASARAKFLRGLA
ncbi:HpcH/HpaI aldolase family protein [Roseococcus sp.]|uniref:HpcH/HpaI aldolase family protein n=1 Tax=Roseococcus sp. TaxID=2109646 RepID=UPI003BADAC5B